MAVRTFIVDKLVRDLIPEHLARREIGFTTSTLDYGEFVKRLRAKLIEEAHEVAVAQSPAEMLEELSDVYEVILTLLSESGFSLAELEARRSAKRATNGAFEKRVYIPEITIDGDNPACLYYLQRPDDYPEKK